MDPRERLRFSTSRFRKSWVMQPGDRKGAEFVERDRGFWEEQLDHLAEFGP
jgi:hypothetical protein